ncbi:hypothetical protein PO124_33450 [Bacillus licheniformis]|nr:hypothetical protein [Bacillus licheniformis]
MKETEASLLVLLPKHIMNKPHQCTSICDCFSVPEDPATGSAIGVSQGIYCITAI